MQTITEKISTRYNPEREHAALFARSLSQTLTPKTIQVPLTSGDVFHANGRVMRIPRGEVDAAFVPRRGMVNNTIVTPPVPARVALQSFRVPKGVGATLAFDYAAFLASTDVSVKYFNAIGRLASEHLQRTAKHDFDLMTDTALAAQIDPQAAGQRLRSKTLTRTAVNPNRKTTRIRGWSRR